MAQVGERQQRLLRELEKLALEGGAGCGAGRGASAPRRSSARRALRRVARLCARRRARRPRRARALLTYLRLREQGERASGLTYVMAQRLREALAVAVRLQAGEPVARGAARAADARARRRAVRRGRRRAAEPERLRGGARARSRTSSSTPAAARRLRARRGALAGMGEDTLAVRAIEAIGR